jgi:predicted rRNA methylase YqxC with S4 and FtsJ domains
MCGTFESPIKGAKGNREFFIHLKCSEVNKLEI